MTTTADDKKSWSRRLIDEISQYAMYKKADQEAQMLKPLVKLLGYYDDQVVDMRSTMDHMATELNDLATSLREVDANNSNTNKDIAEVREHIESCLVRLDRLEEEQMTSPDENEVT